MKVLDSFRNEHYDRKLGDIILVDEGILFVHDSSDRELYFPSGRAIAVQPSGIFGAVNLINKLQENETQEHKIVDDELETLLGSELTEFIEWRDIKNIKKAFLSGVITVSLRSGKKITISNIGRERALDIIAKKLGVL